MGQAEFTSLSIQGNIQQAQGGQMGASRKKSYMCPLPLQIPGVSSQGMLPSAWDRLPGLFPGSTLNSLFSSAQNKRQRELGY